MYNINNDYVIIVIFVHIFSIKHIGSCYFTVKQITLNRL